MAQTEYRPRSFTGSFKKINNVISIKARPIFAEKTIFRGSDRPISHPLAATSFVVFHQFANLSRIDRKEHHLGVASSFSSKWTNPSSEYPLHDNNLSLSLFSAKVCLNDPSFAVISRGKRIKGKKKIERGRIRAGANDQSVIESKF